MKTLKKIIQFDSLLDDLGVIVKFNKQTGKTEVLIKDSIKPNK